MCRITKDFGCPVAGLIEIDAICSAVNLRYVRMDVVELLGLEVGRWIQIRLLLVLQHCV